MEDDVTMPAQATRAAAAEHGPKRPAAPRGGRAYAVMLFTAAALFILATAYMQFDPMDILLQPQNFIDFLTQDFFPPKFSSLSKNLDTLLITAQMALGSSFLSAVFAFFTSLLGSKYTVRVLWLNRVVRGVASFFRNIPPLVWAFILFMSLGVGTGVGFVALTIVTYGFLVRAFIETIDEVSTGPLEALTACGAGFWQKVVHAVLPSCLQGFISWFLYCVEVNIRDSSIIGMVGGGGIGLVMLTYLKQFKYQSASALILAVAALIIGVDWLTGYLRRKVEAL